LLLLHFGQNKRILQRFIIALVNVPVEAFYWRRLTTDERKHDVKMTSRMTEHDVRKTGLETESEMESIFRNFLRENSMKIIFFF